MSKTNLVNLLQWDSQFFGFAVAQIYGNQINKYAIKEIFEFCDSNKVKLLQFKCDNHDRASVLLAEQNRFHFADTRMNYSLKINRGQFQLPDSVIDYSFRLGEKRDLPILEDIAQDLYLESRYHFDKNFPQDRVRFFYSNWIKKAVLGTFDDLAWVITKHDHPVGFCSIVFREPNIAQIGLVGLHPLETGKGLGKYLMANVLHSLEKSDVKQVDVVTQGRNYSAQRLYQRAGFTIDNIETYYHKWF